MLYNFTNKLFLDRYWVNTAVVIGLAIPFILIAMSIDTRTFNGINVWIKPLKFHLSGVIHLLTLFVIASLMDDVRRRKRALIVLVFLSCFATLFEMVIIDIRAAQAVASHYNYSTPFNALLYAVMGVGAVTMLVPTLYLGWQYYRHGREFNCGPGLRSGVAIGFPAAFVLTLVFAGYMSSSGSHWTSGQDSDANGLWLIGWSTTGGDLRPAHFFALHLMQAAPLAGWLGDRWSSKDSALGKPLAWLVAIVFSAVSIFAFLQALEGKAFLSVT